jgi:hypothetical protein
LRRTLTLDLELALRRLTGCIARNFCAGFALVRLSQTLLLIASQHTTLEIRFRLARRLHGALGLLLHFELQFRLSLLALPQLPLDIGVGRYSSACK